MASARDSLDCDRTYLTGSFANGLAIPAHAMLPAQICLKWCRHGSGAGKLDIINRPSKMLKEEALMTSRRTTTTTNKEAQVSKGSQNDQQEDNTNYIQMDGIRLSAPWRLGSYGDDGALSEEDHAALAERFQLSANVLETLSQQLGYCLDTESEINLVEVDKATAIKRANLKLEKAAQLAKRIEADTKEVNQILEGLTVDFAHSAEAANLLETGKQQANASLDASAGLHDAIDLVIKTPGAASDMSPRDKKLVRDKRRQAVVETCCYAWLDADRQLTYTTVSYGSKSEQRQGMLVDFIQNVVARLTDPSQNLAAETLRKDIDRLKKNGLCRIHY